MPFIPAELIKKKREGLAHSPEEISFLIQQFLKGGVTDYQMSAWLMAVFFQGASPMEISTLTKTMRDSGSILNFQSLHGQPVDKHSTGGLGDKTSLILAPIVAASGVPVPMISGRGLGHTGGTLDKLDSIPGFRTQLTKKEIESQVESINVAMVGQTSDICPADQKLYALRDVTATVDSPPLICASIMSKKLAENIRALVLDVKFGTGAFIKDFNEARSLARLLIQTGESNNVKTVAFLTNMNQPLGRYVGNALEVKECMDILKGQTHLESGIDFYEDIRTLSLQLAGQMICLGEKASSLEEGIGKATDILSSGEAYNKFMEICEHQGPGHIDQLPFTDRVYEVPSQDHGYINGINVEKLGWIAVEMGVGRKSIHDKIDPSAGIEWCCKIGQKMTKGQPIARVHCESREKAQSAILNIPGTIKTGPPCPSIQLITEILTE